MQPFRVAIAGLGTVGAETARILLTDAEMLSARAGRPIELTAVSARDRNRDRGIDLAGIDWLDDTVALARSEERRVGKECRARWSRGHLEARHNAEWRAAQD